MAVSAKSEELQRAKAIVRDYHAALGLDKGPDNVRVKQALETHYAPEVIYSTANHIYSHG